MSQAKIIGQATLLLPLFLGCLPAQMLSTPPSPVRPWSSNIIMPQARSFSLYPNSQAVLLTKVVVKVAILEQVATTTMDIHLKNPTHRRLPAELLVPVPPRAVVRGFAFQGGAAEPTAELLTKEEARRIYQGLVAKIKDPALLEFAGYNLIRSSVFPVEPQGNQRLRLIYEHILEADGDRVDYLLPRSESLANRTPWEITTTIKAKQKISTVYSPSHQISVKRADSFSLSVTLTGQNPTNPGPFRLSYLMEKNGLTASMMAYPDPKVGGGYFLMLLGLPAATRENKSGPAIKREVTIVLDRSGSMAGEKLAQATAAAKQILAGLEKGESFNLIVYNEGVDPFASDPVVKTAATFKAACQWLASVKARGGTNIHDALVETLRCKPTPGTLPLVLFLTDGLPTIGQTSEAAIRDVVLKGNRGKRRIFTFGVGVDVNTPLLEKIASETRATATFVLPKEDVELKVAQVFNRLSGPILTAPVLTLTDGQGQDGRGMVRQILPSRLPDLFAGDQLVLLGQYVREEPVTFQISGNYLGQQKRFGFHFDFKKATTKNSFVPRLWASRKIAVLIDAIRQLGADSSIPPISKRVESHPKFKELVEEIVRLSTEFGVLTEYTAFLAREGMDLTHLGAAFQEAGGNFYSRAIQTRSGLSSLNQDLNRQLLAGSKVNNPANFFFDSNLNRVAISNVQQVGNRAFFKHGNRWVDSRLARTKSKAQPSSVIHFGSQDYYNLLQRLVREGRQGTIALKGDILLAVDGKSILVKGPNSK